VEGNHAGRQCQFERQGQPRGDRKIAASPSPVARYFKTYARTGQPLWDEITVALAIDRSLVTQDLTVRMDVDTMPGMHYGEPQVWPEETAPRTGVRRSTSCAPSTPTAS
jgi:inosine-uridine nucleoside N-ribohydrolase